MHTRSRMKDSDLRNRALTLAKERDNISDYVWESALNMAEANTPTNCHIYILMVPPMSQGKVFFKDL